MTIQHKKKILIVDDDKTWLFYFKEVLGEERYEFHVAEDGIRGLKQALELGGHLAALISDTNMPGLNGIELLEEVKRARPTLPFILMFTMLKHAEISEEEIISKGAIVMKKDDRELPQKLRKIMNTLV